ncbi:cytochrome P450 [Apiospora aurea]|uniref:Cytochrome P450 n=1 Tax=Apiospora aurea TaxID=335848 RepID=A0ABR1QUD8_9PEZI
MTEGSPRSPKQSHSMGLPIALVLLSGAAYYARVWDPTSASGAAVLLGILCHQAVLRPYEVDSRGWEMLLAYLAVNGGLVAGFVMASTCGLRDAILLACRSGAVFLAGLYGSMLVYRAFFHRIGHFPGPFAARLSNLYQ